MKKKICLIVILFLASTFLVAAKPAGSKSSPSNKKGKKPNIVKPMKKNPRKPLEVQSELEILRKKFENEKLSINDAFQIDLKMLKKRKKQALDELKIEYQQKKRALRKNR